MFVLEDMNDFVKWLDMQVQNLTGKAGNEKGAKLQFTRGQIHELQNLSALINGRSLVIKSAEPKQPETVRTIVIKEEKETREERPSAANNDFLRWVRQHYSPAKYRQACLMIEDKQTEEDVRLFLDDKDVEVTNAE